MNWYKRAVNVRKLTPTGIDYAGERQQFIEWWDKARTRHQQLSAQLQAMQPGDPRAAAIQAELHRLNTQMQNENQGMQLMDASEQQNQQRMGDPRQNRPKYDYAWDNIANPQMWTNPFAAWKQRLDRQYGYGN